MRRVGKTSLMQQMIDYLILEKNIPRDQILFHNFDESIPIPDILQEFIESLHGNEMNSKTYYIFFDEIQKVADWQSKIKIYYDLYPNIKFILSGSSSLHLQKNESHAGRIFEYYIDPLDFEEFLRYTEKEKILSSPYIYREELSKEFELYLRRQFIDCIYFSDIEVAEYIQQLKNKILKEDIL